MLEVFASSSGPARPRSFDFGQSPFHMNEAGSKDQRSLPMRGAADVVLKEGHAAMRDKWTANAMTVSDPTVCGGVPPLELMFRVEGSGARVHCTRGCGD